MCWEADYDFFAAQKKAEEERRKEQQRAGVIEKLRDEANKAGEKVAAESAPIDTAAK